MRIDNTDTNPAPGLDTAGVNPGAPTNQDGRASAAGYGDDGAGDQVQLSSFASRLSAQASSNEPQKLASLQAAYRGGTYNVSPSQIANRIIADALSYSR